MNISDIVKYCLDAFNSINFVSTVLYIILNCRQRPLMSYDDVKLWNKKKMTFDPKTQRRIIQ